MALQINQGGSSSSTAECMYDIFLSFRGEDTRYNFTSHLYKALCDKGFNTFIDDDNLQRGEEISTELLKAIELSMISIVVFSENYASSTWCLKELVKILECKNFGQLVLPVFYKVNPSEVCKQEGKFQIALTKHEEKENRDKVQSWREALTKATDLAGFSYKDGEIVQQESENPENCSRIWCYEDAYEVLTRNMGTDKIQAMILRSPNPVTMKLQGEPFERMKNLKFLFVENVHICEEFQYLPNGLRLLEWHKFPFSSWPSKYCPQKLVALNMSWSSRIKMETIFKQGIQLTNLKHINLQECDSITELPKLCAPNLKTLDLSSCTELVTVHELCVTNLETLNLSFCYKLVTIHESVGFLDRLRIWDLQYCMSLQNLPNNLRLKSLEGFNLEHCSMLEKFPNIHQEMKRLENLHLSESGIKGLPSSIGYLTQLTGLWLKGCHNLRDLPDSTYKLQMLEFLSFDTARLRPPCNFFDGLSVYGFPSLRELYIYECGIELEFLMKPNYFPTLKVLSISGTDIVSIPESLHRFTTLECLDIRSCKQLRQILRLPQFIKRVDARGCTSLDAQSSSRLLNQIGEILCEGERSDILSRDLFLFHWGDERSFMVPGTEIPRRLNSKHHSVGNSISFRVGRKFPNVFAVYFAFGPVPRPSPAVLNVYLSINGFEKVLINFITPYRDASDTLWISSRSHLKLQKLLNESNPSDYNHVEVTYGLIPPIRNLELRRWGVKVECICCPQKSSISSSMAPTLVDNYSDSDLNLPLKKRRKY
ncbi:probable WRKY transcription factor 19 [Quercus lobata]|uniref:probable WRKY transcription factor 19 n=1 Tax=Quercus lobata TaxID=97700 RepID=UPI0012442DB9|nr:probable WRKY transcription factor 19 [Quercus lobata]